jgi:hypothetical protein
MGDIEHWEPMTGRPRSSTAMSTERRHDDGYDFVCLQRDEARSERDRPPSNSGGRGGATRFVALA